MTQEELNQVEEKALEQLKTGKSLFGKEGALGPMLQSFINNALEAHLNDEERDQGNKRNGKGSKTLKTGQASFEINTPQNRHSSFEPQLVKKRQTMLADSLSDKIIGL